MRRALQLATSGSCRVSPNPMVGAVIVAEGRIIGEGYHRHYGGPHAEPNAIMSVSETDRHLLPHSTMYVTLEPCAPNGKTPPCARLIVETGIPHVVVATLDPFAEVAGRGVEIMRQAGVAVDIGLLGAESRWLNRRFITAHTLRRPYIQLKWAETSDGFISAHDGSPIRISTPMSMIWMHRERAMADAIMAGTDTIIHDNPRLDCRLWPARQPESRPLKVSFNSPRLPAGSHVAESHPVLKQSDESLDDFLFRLYDTYHVNSLMVEGGRKTLQTFIDAGLTDELRIEISPVCAHKGTPAPALSDSFLRNFQLRKSEKCGENLLLSFFNEFM